MRPSLAPLAAIATFGILLGSGCESSPAAVSPVTTEPTGSVSLSIVSPGGSAGSSSDGRLDQFQFTSADDAPGSPIGHDDVAFSFAISPPSPWFADVTFGSSRTSFAAMKPGARLPLSEIEGLSISALDEDLRPLRFDLSSVPGTFVLYPDFEPDGTGSIVFAIDVPPVDVTATAASGDRVTIRFSASLVGTEAFVRAKAEDYNRTEPPAPRE